MKDEEMADKYAEEYFGKKTELVEVWKLKSCKENFLAGLKAGRPQWHKVANGDLPEKEDVFLIYTTKGYLLGHYEQGGADGKVDYCGEPYSDFTEYPSEEELVANEVIAWCEIPTFDKE